MSAEPPVDYDEENPRWTADDHARARPASQHPVLAAALKRGRGRPAGSTTSDRTQVSLRLPNVVIEHFKAGGSGWQTRIVETLEREVTAPKKRA